MASIQKRSESSYLLVVEAGYKPDGKRDRRTKTIRIEDKKLLRTKKKLREYLEDELYKFRIEVEAGAYIAPEKMTIEAFIPEWYEKYAKEHLSDSSLAVYMTHIRNHIIPGLGHRRLDQVKPTEIVNFLSKLKRKDGKDEPVSGETKRYVYRVLRNIFNCAVEWQIIAENPVAAVKRPSVKKQKKKQLNVYDEKEVALLFEKAQSEPPHWRIMVTLALAAGLRRGELLGLEWSHVDLEEGEIEIQRTIVKGENGPVFKEPKSADSFRTVSLSQSVVDDLKAFRIHWLEEKMKFADIRVEKEREYLLNNEDGTHFYPDTPTTWWGRFTKRVGIRHIRLHDLRHTSATLLINQGVHARIISERLGHADTRITMQTYGHMTKSADKKAAEKLDHLFVKKSK